MGVAKLHLSGDAGHRQRGRSCRISRCEEGGIGFSYSRAKHWRADITKAAIRPSRSAGAFICLAVLVISTNCTSARENMPSATCQGVPVSPSSSIQALIDANVPRTRFCFRSGLYELSDTISTGDKFPVLDLRAGAIIDGQNGGFIGIDGPNPPADQRGTIVLGGVFQHFGNAASPSWVAPIIVRRNSVVNGTEFRENFNSGLTIQGSNARVTNVFTHHNGRYGLNGGGCGCPADPPSGVNGVIIENTEVAFNNTRQLDIGDDAGGTKFVGWNGAVIRDNNVHDNYGAGLWFDGYNKNIRVYGNRVTDNRNWGIFYELSYGGTTIHHNRLVGNGVGDGVTSDSAWYANVQLLVSCSDGSTGGIEVHSNTIDGEAKALGLINHDQHPIRTRGVYVHDNTFTLRSWTSQVGAMAFDGLTELFTASANNRFEHNDYRVRSRRGSHWTWDGKTLTWRQWQAVGDDEDRIVR